MHSNGIRYCDVALAASCDGLPDNYPDMPLPVEAQAVAIANRLAALVAELSSIHAQVQRAAFNSEQKD
jgi:hypothetical protein